MRILKAFPIKAALIKPNDPAMRNLKNKKATIIKRSENIIKLLSQKNTSMNEQLQYSKELYNLSLSLVDIQDSIDNYDSNTWFRCFDEFTNSDSLDL